MRKHFLILMLMALLPLAGWAADLQEIGATLIAPSYTYGGTQDVKVVVNAHFLDKRGSTPSDDDDFVVVGYYKDNNGSKGDEIANFDPSTANVGTYWVMVEGVNDYENTLEASFIVNPAPLSITFTDEYIATLTKYYLQPDPAQPTVPAMSAGATPTLQMNDFKVTGLVNSENVLDVVDFGAANAAHYDYGTANVNAGTYSVEIKNVTLKTPEGATVPNYTLTKATDVTFKINKVDLKTAAPAGMTLEFVRTGAASKVYNGDFQKTEYAVYYYPTGGERGNAISDSEIKTYFRLLGNTGPIEQTKKYAATYFVRFVGQNSNFTGFKSISSDAMKFTITKAEGLVVKVNSLSKTYDGAAFDLNQARYTFEGLQGQDQIHIADGATVGGTTTALDAAVGTYNVKAVLTNATIGTGEAGEPKVSDNYKIVDDDSNPIETVTPLSAWTIIKRNAKVTVQPYAGETEEGVVKTILYTAAAPTTGANVKLEAFDANRGFVAADATTISGNTPAVFSINYDASKITAATGSFPYFVVNQDVTSADLPVLKNYNIQLVDGILKINGAVAIAQPNIADYDYTGAAPQPTLNLFYETEALDLTEGATPEYEYAETQNGDYNLTADDVKNVGTYWVRVKLNSIKDNAPAGYTIDENSITPAVFTINKKEIKPTAGAVTLRIGDNISLISRSVVTYADDNKKPVGEEAPTYTIGLTADQVDKDANNKITGWHQGVIPTGNTVADIITLAFTEDEVNKNYKLADDYVKGALTLLDTYTLAITTTTKIQDVIDAADNGANYNVTIAGRTLKANDWNVLVLPFDITPFEFTQAIGGYAIFNTLQSANADNNTVKFGIELANLPANEPFLVKPLAAVDFARTTNPISFYKPISKQNLDEAGNPTKTTTSGVKFIGTYASTKVLVAGTDPEETFGYVDDGGEAGKKIMFLGYPTTGKGQFYTATDKPGTKSYNWLGLDSTKAYFDFTGSGLARPTIIVEEADGSTTAISAVTSDGVAVKTEGWYTIDGMKLNAAPTQKGVYINNGKKIVVK